MQSSAAAAKAARGERARERDRMREGMEEMVRETPTGGRGQAGSGSYIVYLGTIPGSVVAVSIMKFMVSP